MLHEIVRKSQRVLVPKGRDHDGCVNAFSNVFSVSIPAFEGRVLSAEEANRNFFKVRSSDIPMLMERGYGDIGLAYSDVCEEYIAKDSQLTYEVIGGKHQTYCLLLPEENEKVLRERLYTFSGPPVQVITTYSNIFNKCLQRSLEEGTPLNMELSPVNTGGCTEGMTALGVADIVGDIVNTGETARANKLVPIPLFDISPVLIYRKTPIAHATPVV
jgi:ATP phosphoribosyltransferase